MQRTDLPKIFTALRKIGVVLEYSFFERAGGGREERLAAIDAHLTNADDTARPYLPTPAREALANVQDRKITREQFLGDWCDPNDSMLVLRGSGKLETLGEMENPRYDAIGDHPVVSWGNGIPEFEDPGQYAYAFAQPPYGLKAKRSRIAQLFRISTEELIPPRMAVSIYDWSEGDLVKIHPTYARGMEWWGVFLFLPCITATPAG